MTPPTSGDGHIRMSETEFEELLAHAAERGAKRALGDVGLEGTEAASDIRDLRSLLDAIRIARRTAIQTIVRLIVTALALAVIAGLVIKLKLFGSAS